MSNTTITSVPGIRAAALHTGIKSTPKPDLALLVSDVPATAAAVFTTNKVVGAPVLVGRQHMPRGKGILRACITNSGCANVCTGPRGLRDATEMCSLTADLLARQFNSEVDISHVLPFSTGVIGRFLPMDKIRAGIPEVIAGLSNSEEAGTAFAHGILTTDLVPKSAHTTVTIGGKKITIAGHCKGSGMIAPNMATMLAYVATDAAIAPATLAALVRRTTEYTFNCVTVDQHTSTSDTFVTMANGLANNRKITGTLIGPLQKGSTPALATFRDAFFWVCDQLAQQIAKDGEGATKLVNVYVTGAKSLSDAKRAAEAIANSPLCKTAIHGADPNWGRFVSAAGYSGAAMNVEKSACTINGLTVFKNGQPTPIDLAAVESEMKKNLLDIEVNLGFPAKKNNWRVYTCDLSREYITINADYHT